MSRYIFSAAQNSFFLLSLKDAYVAAGTWPDDGVAVREAVFIKFTRDIPAGKRRIVGSDGLPAWGDIPPPTPAELQQQAESQKKYLMTQATSAIAPLQYAVDLQMATAAELSALTAWKKYCVLLNRVDCSTAPNIDWPEQPE
ncbi:tail fiber assembly protein [Xenorhabdus sp. TS4]|uniref:tail fiber assembly protein n=1 Tax=Xenorhabdus sp. TS4 TaxID=1873483 RepID=UPI001656A8BB|nr:tail fiber assembly protein [Xenorhabdus sp. TS4]MBC8949621.1 phage tail fiber assembly [Xenorhabdus sp. TS4]